MAKGADDFKLPLTGLLALVVALGGIWLYQVPLKSARPPGTGMEKYDTLGEDRVQARLWQDPILAAQEHFRGERADKLPADHHHRFSHIPIEIAGALLDAERAPSHGPPRLKVLLVMVEGSPYAEGTESRIRHRYAVGSGLGVACYVPIEEEHLRYFYWDAGRALPESEQIVPFEWYEARKTRRCAEPNPRSPQPQEVLVLWLREDIFPLDELRNLTRAIHYGAWEGVVRGLVAGRIARPRAEDEATMLLAHSLEFAIVGPRDSTSLRRLYEDAMDHRTDQLAWPNPDGRISLYSPWATTMPYVLEFSLRDRLRGGGAVTGQMYQQQFESEFQRLAQVDFRYSIGSDDRLFAALIDELERRGVRVGRDEIALISEWDSFYGRALPLEFSALACAAARQREPAGYAGCDTPEAALDIWITQPDRAHALLPSIHRYSYLRGLDGETVGQTRKADSPGEFGQAPAGPLGSTGAAAGLDTLERPEGPSQLDYVRRLAQRLAKDADDAGGIRAIGVLGSDLYDKLLILQALRDAFPKAIFFSTDLDARLLAPSHYRDTRNMILASHFDLALDGALQRDVPPFRDSYQTSLFFGILRAVEHVRFEPPDRYRANLTEHPYSIDLPPRVYEIGRTGAVLLDGRSDGALPLVHPVEPPPQPWYRPPAAGWAIIGLLCVVLLVVPFGAEAAVGLAVVMVLVAAAAWLFWRFSAVPGGEPFVLVEGVSIWPSELIRLTAAALSTYFLVRMDRDLRSNAAQLGKRYELSTSVEDASWLAPRQWLRPVGWGVSHREDHCDVARLWREHLALTEQRWNRIIPQATLFLVLSIALFGVFGAPGSPSRGAISAMADRIVLFISVPLFMLLVFFVVDETRVLAAFISRLRQGESGWPATLTGGYAGKRSAGCVPDWLDIRLLAERTSVVGNLLYYPFIVLALMIVARARLFDNWDFPISLGLVWGLSALLAVVSTVRLSLAAEQARRAAVESLSAQLYKAKETVRRRMRNRSP